MEREDWWDDAACNYGTGQLVTLFYGDHVCTPECDRDGCHGRYAKDRHGRVRQAKEFCRVCPVREKCLAFAVAHNEKHGIWGGMSERELAKYRKRLNNGNSNEESAA